MSENPTLPMLTHAGYLILLPDEAARLRGEYYRSFGRYYGVDRLPPLLAPSMTVGELVVKPSAQNVPLSRTIEEWFDSRYHNTAFIPSRSQALSLFYAFKKSGLWFELAYCQLAFQEGEENRLGDYSTLNEPSPATSLTYGFDVSWPSCNHSAILQPGVVSSDSSWRERLNPYGLLDNYEDALNLRDDYLTIYQYPPFDIYLVHKSQRNEEVIPIR